jgi:hypothetical protein
MTEQATDLAELHIQFVDITVNKKPVRIEPDFQLARVHGEQRKIIGDTDVVELHEHEKFVATASDDNS